jgi:hypothetical protein
LEIVLPVESAEFYARGALLDREAERGDEIVVAPDPERAISFVCVLGYIDLEVEEVPGEILGDSGAGEVKAIGLKQGLKTCDEPGLAQADRPGLSSSPIPMSEVDGRDIALRGGLFDQLQDGISQAGDIDEDVDGASVSSSEPRHDLASSLGRYRKCAPDGETLKMSNAEVVVVLSNRRPAIHDLGHAEGRVLPALSDVNAQRNSSHRTDPPVDCET